MTNAWPVLSNQFTSGNVQEKAVTILGHSFIVSPDLLRS
jgi:hypothetical protein